MSTLYHVLLPPPVLAPLPLVGPVLDLAPIELHQLPTPSGTQSLVLTASGPSRGHSILTRLSQSQGTQTSTQARPSGQQCVRTHSNIERPGIDSGATTSQLKDPVTTCSDRSLDPQHKRARTNEDHLAVNMARRRLRTSGQDIAQTGYEQALIGSASHMGSKSQMIDSASLLSLNTTNSNPSQFPRATGETSTANVPQWILPIPRLTSLHHLLGPARSRLGSGDRKSISCMVCVLSVEAPKALQRKAIRGRAQQEELHLAKWEVVGPPIQEGGKESSMVDVKLWDGCALEYGDDVRRGDVVLLDSTLSRPRLSFLRIPFICFAVTGLPSPDIRQDD